MKPEYEPPADPRLWVDRVLIRRVDWIRMKDGQLPGPPEHAVADRIANYGNPDGTNCRPSEDRLAWDLGRSVKAVGRSIDWNAEYGWLRLDNPGVRHKGTANVFSTTVPSFWLAYHGWWPDDQPLWIARPKGEPLRAAVRKGGRWCPPSSRPGEEPGNPVGVSWPHVRKAIREHFAERGIDLTAGLKGGHWCPQRGSLVSTKGVTHDPPPGVTREIHHSARTSRGQSDDRPRENWPPPIEPDDPDDPFDPAALDQLHGRVDGALGYEPTDPGTVSGIAGMYASGEHPNAIVNAAVAREIGSQAKRSEW